MTMVNVASVNILGRLKRFWSTPGEEPVRDSGYPQSGNGASSFHLFWVFDSDFQGITSEMLRFSSVEVDFEILETPSVSLTHFWAVQVGFTDELNSDFGAAHTGIQVNRSFPNHRAANWGGYDAIGNQLTGSQLEIPRIPGDPNTGAFDWEPATKYRIRICENEQLDTSLTTTQTASHKRHSEDRQIHAWQSTITNLETGVQTRIRDLYSPGDRLRDIILFSEIFAKCDSPSASICWSNPKATLVGLDLKRSEVPRTIPNSSTQVQSPTRVRLSYESVRGGGCSNTNSYADIERGGIVQQTNTQRQNHADTELIWPSAEH